MSPNLFGTDGVRGVANDELTPERAFFLGEIGARQLSGAAIVVGRDTRRSGDLLEHALIAGICAAGADVLMVGVVPTPAVAFLVGDLGAAGGVMISASHNPAEYNGIKFFDAGGYKLSVEEELAISEAVLAAEAGQRHARPVGAGIGRVVPVPDADERYIDHCVSTIEGDLSGIRIVLDCANGAACVTSPAILRQLGAEVRVLNASPDGMNINAGCGSTELGALRKGLAGYDAHVGLAHDGDADRVLVVDPDGTLVNGDRIMAVCAREMKRRGALPSDTVVVTVMTNEGFVEAMTQEGITTVRTPVGDREVLAEMRRRGAALGGEQSGHIIFSDYNTTGDGIVTALKFLSALRESGASPKEIASFMKEYRQASRIVNVANPTSLGGSERITCAVAEAEERLAGHGRVVVRPSGTEPVVRVMVEAVEAAEANRAADALAHLIAEELGGSVG